MTKAAGAAQTALSSWPLCTSLVQAGGLVTHTTRLQKQRTNGNSSSHHSRREQQLAQRDHGVTGPVLARASTHLTQ